MSRLKAKLEKAQSRNAELEKTAAEEKQLRVEETRKLKESLEESESRAISAEGEIEALKTKISRWLVEISTINSEMNSKSFPLLSLLTSNICRHMTYPGVSHFQFRTLPPLRSCCGKQHPQVSGEENPRWPDLG